MVDTRKTLVIGGKDYSHKIAENTLQIQLVDFDGDNANTTLDLVNHRDYLGSLFKISVTLTKLNAAEMATLYTAISQPNFKAQFWDFRTNKFVEATFQKTSIDSVLQKQTRDGDKIYTGISFNLNQSGTEMTEVTTGTGETP